ncbi:MAG: sulfite exporter TauE/SafE family protein [Phycisphaerae bacterium]
MLNSTDALLTAAFLVVAAAYAMVGHAGASGYLAVMTLAGFTSDRMRPIALTLNVLVAAVGTVQFGRAGLVKWRQVLPFVAMSVPLAYWGGSKNAPPRVQELIIGTALLLAAVRLAWTAQRSAGPVRPPPLPVALLCGGALGALSGLTGVGGGVFLTPLILLMGWAEPRVAAGTSVVFILLNSLAGMAGLGISPSRLPPQIGVWAAAVLLGGTIGATMGSRRLSGVALRRVLAAVVLLAAGKLLLAGAAGSHSSGKSARGAAETEPRS